MKKILILLIAVVAIGVIWKAFPLFKNFEVSEKNKATDPLNATYMIDNTSITLVNGSVTSDIAPNSASKLVTKVFSQPSYGDLNEDGIDDSVMIVTQSGGGSGEFYYALIALSENGTWHGLSGIYLGDRIAPQSALIKDDVAIVNFAERKPDEPFTAKPSVGVTKYLAVENGEVKEFNLLSQGEQLFVGNLIMAHEARIFTPCGGTAHWLLGASPAYSNLLKAYEQNKSTTSPYASVYAVVSGVITSNIPEEFGKSYNFGINVKNLIKVIPGGSCS